MLHSAPTTHRQGEDVKEFASPSQILCPLLQVQRRRTTTITITRQAGEGRRGRHKARICKRMVIKFDYPFAEGRSNTPIIDTTARTPWSTTSASSTSPAPANGEHLRTTTSSTTRGTLCFPAGKTTTRCRHLADDQSHRLTLRLCRKFNMYGLPFTVRNPAAAWDLGANSTPAPAKPHSLGGSR
jgi:hypothetical protein